MDQDRLDALVLSILATEAQRPAAKVRLGIPHDLDRTVRKHYEQAEDFLLEECRADLVCDRLRRPIGPAGPDGKRTKLTQYLQKKVAFHASKAHEHGCGILLGDRGGSSEYEHWNGVPTGILAKHLPLLSDLLQKAVDTQGLADSKVLASSGMARSMGIHVPLMNAMKPQVPAPQTRQTVNEVPRANRIYAKNTPVQEIIGTGGSRDSFDDFKEFMPAPTRNMLAREPEGIRKDDAGLAEVLGTSFAGLHGMTLTPHPPGPVHASEGDVLLLEGSWT